MSAFPAPAWPRSGLNTQQPGRNPDEETLGLQTRVLANGLTVASVPLPGFRSVSVGAFIRVGARDEPEALNGLSHFLEHMAFKGTATRSARQISFEIERVGAVMNAYTAKDHTAYHATLLPEHLPVALDVLADVLLRSAFPPDEIERERQVILQEIGDAADDPESVAQDEFDLKAWPDQPLGRPILGGPRFVKRVVRDDFLNYLQTHYCAANLVLVAAGQVDPDRFADEVEKRFGALHRGHRADRVTARYVGGFRQVEDEFEQTSVALGWPIPGRTDPQYAVFELLGELLGGGMSSPLFQSVREQRGLAYQIDAWTEGHDDCGLLQITAGVAPRNLRVLLEVICDELQALTRSVSAEDLERTRNQQLTHLARSLERPMDLAEGVARDLLLHGRVITPAERMAVTRSIHAEVLQQAAARLIAQPPTLVLVGRAGRGDPYQKLRNRLGPFA